MSSNPRSGMLWAVSLLVACASVVASSAHAEIDADLLLRAEQGSVRAQYEIAGIYKKGRGVTRDETAAAHWYSQAAEAGYARAQLNLAIIYENGQGVPQDDVEALRWYRSAAEQGDAYAQSCVGYMYENGVGVAADEAEAIRWYQLAAAQGDPDAKDALRDLGIR